MSSTRTSTVRRTAGYGAALAMAAYLAVKCAWVLASVTTNDVPDSWDRADWIALNVVTIGMASVGVALGLALAQDWGSRIPAPWVVGLGWIGSGFLVTLLPYLVVSGALHGLGLIQPDSQPPGEDAMPPWEATLLGVAFAGMGLGLLVALPIYIRERWPDAFERRMPGHSTGRSIAVWAAAAAALVLGIMWLGWSLGAEPGLRAGAGTFDTDTRLLLATWGTWALVASGAVVVLGAAAGRSGMATSRVLAFFASGSLFAWSAWKLPLTAWAAPDRKDDVLPVLSTGQHVVGIIAGLLTLYVLLGRNPRTRDS